LSRYISPTDSHSDDFYEQFEARFDSLNLDRKMRRLRKPKLKHIPKKSDDQVLSDSADVVGLEGGFNPTYHPSRHEEGWLLDSLGAFYDQSLITDVLYVVRGGKEATVYCCAAHPSTGVELVAAKVYRPRVFRQIRNDGLYREGRDLLTAEGRAVRKTDHRILRAVGKKTSFGVQVAHTSWLMHEYTSLQTLYAAGAAVPRPIASTENAILMGFCGDERMAAPALSHITLDDAEADVLFQETVRNVEIMLRHDLIHGDLSAYNILYWEGQITLIDFPQVVTSQDNRSAYMILHRDVTRVCEYFERQGVPSDPQAVVDRLWARYSQATPDEPFDEDEEDEAED
jgi:RIO kinase 1